jgi:hypothetical protein
LPTKGFVTKDDFANEEISAISEKQTVENFSSETSSEIAVEIAEDKA